MPKRLTVQWTGLDSFKDELQALTTNMVDEANSIMRASATQARTAIAAAYPAKSGRLRAGLVIRDARGVVLAGAELVQTAPHGWIFEHGTHPRENRAGQFRGVMRARPTFIPIASAHRQGAIAQVINRLYAHGAARVTGSAEQEQ